MQKQIELINLTIRLMNVNQRRDMLSINTYLGLQMTMHDLIVCK